MKIKVNSDQINLKREIAKLIAKWQPILELDHWVIQVIFGKTSDETRPAECLPWREMQRAKITFNLELKEWSDPILRELFVVHELLHCVSAVWAGEIEDVISNNVSEELQDEVRKRVNLPEEKYTCDLARILWSLKRK